MWLTVYVPLSYVNGNFAMRQSNQHSGPDAITDGMAEGLRQAKAAAGGDTQLGAALGIHRTAVFRWRKVPAEWVVPIEKIYGVPRAVLRPDLFGEGG